MSDGMLWQCKDVVFLLILLSWCCLSSLHFRQSIKGSIHLQRVYHVGSVLPAPLHPYHQAGEDEGSGDDAPAPADPMFDDLDRAEGAGPQGRQRAVLQRQETRMLRCVASWLKGNA